jgi:hypothetical protein
MPDDVIYNPHNFHPDAIAWLAKAYIFNSTIIEQGIGYCPEIHKVFMPAYSPDGVLQFYQLRALDPGVLDQYKYLTYGKSSAYLIMYEDWTSSNKVIIVEDHLSAIRLRKFGNVCSLSGTFLSHPSCQRLVDKFRTFIFWLDPDAPGRAAMLKNLMRLQQYADKYSIKCLFTSGVDPDYSFYHINYAKITQDPKYFRDCDIAEILNDEVILCEKQVKGYIGQ